MQRITEKEWLRSWGISTMEASAWDQSKESRLSERLNLMENKDVASMKFCPHCGHELIMAEVDGISRKKCPSESCSYVFWNNPVPVVGAIVEKAEEVVLVRNKQWPPKIFGLVTGFLEKGETPEAGILREVKEELGLEGQIVDFVGYYPFFQMNQLILAFYVKVKGTITLGEELAEIKSIHPEKLSPWRFGTGYAVEDWLKKWKNRNRHSILVEN